MPRRILPALVGLIALALAGPVDAAPAPSRTTLISTTADGTQMTGHSYRPAVSDDGRFVLFESESTLVPGDTNGALDMFLRDLHLGTIERVSISAAGAEGNDDSYAGFMSPDARFVGFVSNASNLVPGDTNSCIDPIAGTPYSCGDVFLLDRATGTLERVSISSTEVQGNGESYNGVAMSPDGRFLAFWSASTNLAPGDTNARGDIFVRDRIAGTTQRVSVGSGGVQADATSSEPAISNDGRFVAFKSYATNLAGLDIDLSPGGYSDIYVHDRETGQTERVSVSSDGEDGIVNSYRPAISGDGRYVAFDSEATNLVPADTNGFGFDVFVHDRTTGRTEQVSVNSAGIQANDNSYNPWITPDGRYVVFASNATNLGPDDGGICFLNSIEGNASCRDLFIHDRETGQTDPVAVPVEGRQMDGLVWESVASTDARYVAFESGSSTLVPDDGNEAVDAFLTDRGPATGVAEVAASPGPEAVAVSGWARFGGVSISDADSPTDAGPGSRQAGTELIGARLAHRPEEGDLLARLELDRLPPTPRPFSGAQARLASLPGVVYGLELTVGGSRYEIRATRGLTSRWATASSFTLLRCTPACAEVEPLTGSIGTTGDHVNIAVPLAALGVTSGAEITSVRAFVGPGEAATGPATMIDEVRLPSLELSPSSVELGIAPAGTPQGEVSFSTAATLNGGDFTGALDTAGFSSGTYDVWARACVGARCGSSSTPVEIG
ncbi:MAG: TolB family protein [Actinomycetota bacterium]